MAERKQLPIMLLALPVAIMGVMLGVQYFAPDQAQTDEPAIEEPAEQAESAPEPVEKEPSAAEARTRLEFEKTYRLEDDRFVATFTDLNTGLVSVSIKGDRYLDE